MEEVEGQVAIRMALSGRLGRTAEHGAKSICAVFVVLGTVYYIAHYGFLSFLLRMIFTPVP
jgi:hypothetical protein